MSDPSEPSIPVPPVPPAAPAAPAPPAAPLPPAEPAPARKDRLVQTRVPRELERRLKQEASRRRVTLSQLVRGLLEDTVALVDDVLESVDGIVADSVDFAEGLAEDLAASADRGLRIARKASRRGRLAGDEELREARVPETPEPLPAHLAQVDAWNPVILNRTARCAECDRDIVRGDQGYLGVGPGPTVWLCSRCIREL